MAVDEEVEVTGGDVHYVLIPNQSVSVPWSQVRIFLLTTPELHPRRQLQGR